MDTKRIIRKRVTLKFEHIFGGLGGRSGNSKFVNRTKKEKLLQWCGHIERMDTNKKDSNIKI
jgi:hypothetical protein